MVDLNIGQRDIARVLGIGKTTVHDTIERMKELPDAISAYSRPRSGRPPALDTRACRRLALEITRTPGKPWKHFAELLQVSVTTLRKAAKGMGFNKRHRRRKSFLGKRHKQLRKEWVKDNDEQDWRRVIFTDECAVEIGEDLRSQWTIRKDGEAWLPQHIQQTYRSGRQSLMIWGAIAYGKKFPLQRLPVKADAKDDGLSKKKGLNGKRYVEYVLKGPLKRAVKSQRTRRWTTILVVEDGAPPHRSPFARAAREQLGISTLYHPPCSPDLNPIENVWSLVKHRIGQMPRKATNLDKLWEQVQQAWDEIDIKIINDLIDGMEKRVVAVQAARGAQTKW